MQQINHLLRERHRVGPGEFSYFAVRDFTEVVHAVKGTVGLVAGLLLCVGLISLLVGGIGIMNVMLVTVTERYRKSASAWLWGGARDILQQFLVEAVDDSACSGEQSALPLAEEPLCSCGRSLAGRPNPRPLLSWRRFRFPSQSGRSLAITPLGKPHDSIRSKPSGSSETQLCYEKREIGITRSQGPLSSRERLYHG